MSIDTSAIQNQAKKTRQLLADYQKHAQRISAAMEEQAALKLEVEKFLEDSDASDDALKLTISKRSKIELLGGMVLLLERKAEPITTALLDETRSCMDALRAVQLQERRELLETVVAAIRPFSPDYRDDKNEELKQPSIGLAERCRIFSWFGPIDVSEGSLAHECRDNNPAKWDREVVEFCRSVLGAVKKWQDNNCSFVPKDFGKS